MAFVVDVHFLDQSEGKKNVKNRKIQHFPPFRVIKLTQINKKKKIVACLPSVLFKTLSFAIIYKIIYKSNKMCIKYFIFILGESKSLYRVEALNNYCWIVED